MSEPQIETAITLQQAHYRRISETSVAEEGRLFGSAMLEFVGPLIRWLHSHGTRATTKGAMLRALTCAAAAIVAQAIRMTPDDNERATRNYSIKLFEDEIDRLLMQKGAETVLHRTDA